MQDHFGLEETKAKTKSVLNRIEKIRNNLAHSQDIVSGTTWEKLIEDVQKVERMLQRSDEIVERDAHNKAINP